MYAIWSDITSLFLAFLALFLTPFFHLLHKTRGIRGLRRFSIRVNWLNGATVAHGRLLWACACCTYKSAQILEEQGLELHSRALPHTRFKQQTGLSPLPFHADNNLAIPIPISSFLSPTASLIFFPFFYASQWPCCFVVVVWFRGYTSPVLVANDWTKTPTAKSAGTLCPVWGKDAPKHCKLRYTQVSR